MAGTSLIRMVLAYLVGLPRERPALTAKTKAEMIPATARKTRAESGRRNGRGISCLCMVVLLLAWLGDPATQVALSAYIISESKSSAMCARTGGKSLLVFA